MKKVFFLISTCLFLAISSCKTDSEEPTPVSADPSFSATINGANWPSTAFTATYRNEMFVMNANSSSGEKLIIRMKLVSGRETTQAFYSFKGEDDVSLAIFVGAPNDPELATNQYAANADAGKISFTKFDKTAKKVSGTFDFKVIRSTDKEEKTIKGTFENVSYDDKAVTLPSKEMSATVGGNAWKAITIEGVSNASTKILTVKGIASDGSHIMISLPYKAIPATYKTAMFGGGGSKSAQYSPSASNVFIAETGTIIVTEHDPDAKYIKGSFSFEYDSGKMVTAGTFTSTY